jgi:hypothetical protein
MHKTKKELYKKPNPFVYFLFKLSSLIMSKFKFNLKVLRNEVALAKRPYVLIANHASSIDFINVCKSIKGRAHFVISNSFYQSLSIKPFLKACAVIPKNQFQTTVVDLKKMKQVIDNKMPLVIYPAGMMTEDGTSTPIPLATGKALKWLNADIYVAYSKGSYFTKPKWGKKFRKGKITIDIYKLYDKEVLSTLTNDEVQFAVEKALFFDEYAEQAKNPIPYKKGNLIEGLENVLFKCPDCGKEFTFETKFDTMTCKNCGYSVVADKFGLLNLKRGKKLKHRFVSTWAKENEKILFDEILTNKDFTLKDEVIIKQIDDKKHKYVTVGKGKITLDSEKFLLDATINNEQVVKEFFTSTFPTMPFSPGKYFELQDGTTIYRIEPKNGKQVIKWAIALKIFYKLQKGCNYFEQTK